MENFNIILIEDRPFFAKSLKMVIKKFGLNVITLSDIQAVIQELYSSKKEIKLIIYILEMPGLNGFELAKEIRLSHKHSRTPMLGICSRLDSFYMYSDVKLVFDVFLERVDVKHIENSIVKLIA